jgi:adenine-specific DNA-methyltransferase
MSSFKDELLAELHRRVEDKILEPTNAELLCKLITNAESDNEAMSIAELGTTYKRTGLHFDKRLERMTNDIRYFKKNDKLSFHTDDSKPIHKLIIGDNYEALQNLLIQYKGLIDVIYIDPPYGKDSMGEFAQTNYQNAITRDNLLSMLYPRLQLAKQLLSDSGVIFCSVDDRNHAYIKCLFDEVFGEGNFVDTLHWKRKKQPSFLAKHTAKVMEYVLVFAKKWDLMGKLSVDTVSDSTKKVINLTNQLSVRHFKAGVRVKCGQSGKIPKGIYTIKTMTVEYLDDVYYEQGLTKNEVDVKANFSVSQDKINKYIDEKLLFITTNYGLRRDVSEEETNNVKAITDLLLDWGDNQDSEKELKEIFGDKLFDYSKPTKLIYNLIKSTRIEDSIVLDFFAGSGTTGHAVLDLEEKESGNRTFILCQLNEKTDSTPNGIAYDVTAKRLKRIMTGECYDGSKNFEWIKKNKPYGGNLDVYEIESVANFEATEGKTPFDVIDETLYGFQHFNSKKEKIEWVCSNFFNTQNQLESDEERYDRIKGE